MSVARVRQACASVVAINVTPFGADGGIDLDAYGRLVDRQVRAGIDVVTANGNTGEFYALDHAEQAAAVRATVAAAGAAVVLAGVGHSAREAAAEAADAVRAGAHGVMVHQPVHPYQSTEGWIAYHREVADAVPDHGVVLYVRSPLIGAEAFTRLADACPNVVGVKYSVPDPLALAELIRVVGTERLAWSCGLAESWAPYFWLSGARGFTSGLATVAPEEPQVLLGRLRSGDSAGAMAIWRQLRPFEELRARRANALNVSVVKEALAQLGLCRPDVRPPASRLTEAERAEVQSIIAGFAVVAAS